MSFLNFADTLASWTCTRQVDVLKALRILVDNCGGERQNTGLEQQ